MSETPSPTPQPNQPSTYLYKNNNKDDNDITVLIGPVIINLCCQRQSETKMSDNDKTVQCACYLQPHIYVSGYSLGA